MAVEGIQNSGFVHLRIWAHAGESALIKEKTDLECAVVPQNRTRRPCAS